MIGSGPQPMSLQQVRYQAYVDKFSAYDSVSQDTVSLLKTITIEELITPVFRDIFKPVIDGEWIRGATIGHVQNIPNMSDLTVRACAYELPYTIYALYKLDSS